MKRIVLAALFALLIFCTSQAEVNYKNLQSSRVYSTVLKEYRDLSILLPNGYENTYHSYPVIYLLDAEKNFDVGIEALSFMMDNHFIPPHIVVGITNTDRFRDMTPVDSVLNKTIFPTRGGADNFIKSLEVDIFPFVASKFRASSRRLVMGHNYSGLFVVHTFINKPELFDRYLAFSPILWWNNKAIVNDMEKFLSERHSLRKHFFMSFAKEAKNMLEACTSLTKVIVTKSPDDLNWNYEWMPDEDHYSLYRKSLMKGMETIFKDYKYPSVQDLASGGVEKAQEYQATILLNYGRNEKLPYTLLISVCSELKDKKEYNDALRFLNYTIQNYPKRAETYFYIGEIYEATNQFKEALRFYEIAYNKDKGRWDYEQKFLAIQKQLTEMANEAQGELDL